MWSLVSLSFLVKGLVGVIFVLLISFVMGVEGLGQFGWLIGNMVLAG